jgi:hypothetical protein
MKTIDQNRKTALVAGVLYILTFVSIPILVIYGPLRHSDYILGSGPDSPVIIGGILEIIVALTGIGSAVALYTVLKRQNEGVALALVASRVLEASTIFVGVMLILSVVILRQQSAGAEALVISHILVTMYDRMFLLGQGIMPAVNDLLLGFLLYHSRLVPRGLSVIGIIGGPVLLAGDFCILFNIVGHLDPTTGLFAVPFALFEFSLGIYLMVKGFRPSSITHDNELKGSLYPHI